MKTPSRTAAWASSFMPSRRQKKHRLADERQKDRTEHNGGHQNQQRQFVADRETVVTVHESLRSLGSTSFNR